MGMGEKLSDLELFYPDRMAGRILGMGDILTLIDKAEAQFDEQKAREMERKIKKADFNFDDFLEQMTQVEKMGGIADMLNLLPGMGSKLKDVEVDEGALVRTKSIIYSMTKAERSDPSLLNLSRKRRIAFGAGVDISEVNALVKQLEQTKKMMKQMSGLMGGKGGKRGRFRMPFGL